MVAYGVSCEDQSLEPATKQFNSANYPGSILIVLVHVILNYHNMPCCLYALCWDEASVPACGLDADLAPEPCSEVRQSLLPNAENRHLAAAA